jgi:integrase
LRGALEVEQAEGYLIRAGNNLATRESFEREQRMIAAVDRGAGRFERLGGEREFQPSERLRDEQRRAVHEVLASRDLAISLCGAAGTGKTATLQEIERGLREAGRKVTAVAPTRSAVEELHKVGIRDAMTVPRLLEDETQQGAVRGKVLIVDEAGMISGRQMDELFKLAERGNVRLLFSGDTRQIQSVEASDALRILERESQLKSVSLTGVQRQTQAEYRDAIQTLRDTPEQGFEKLEIRYYETDSTGQRKRQSVILGDCNLYTTETLARKATQALLLRLNDESPRAEVEAASFGALLDRYIEQELSERYSTRKSHLSNIRVHIRPRWGEYPVDKLKPMAMEQWLRDLPLAPKSKTHVRGIVHLVFKCAERWGIIELGKNPVSLVRVKNASKRLKRPRILEVGQFFELLKHLSEPYRTMVLVAQCLGLRVSEILGLQWGDFNFEERTVLVQRSVVGGRVDDVKTEYSKDEVPLDRIRTDTVEQQPALRSRKTDVAEFDGGVHGSLKVSPSAKFDVGIDSCREQARPALLLGLMIKQTDEWHPQGKVPLQHHSIHTPIALILSN